MIIQGIELDIYPETLEEWNRLSGDIELHLNKLFTESIDCSYQTPVAYTKADKGYADPIPKDIHEILKALDRHRFKELMNLKESLEYLQSKGFPITSPQSVTLIFDRYEDALGILPELPKTVEAKAKDRRQSLEWRRKRRITQRENKHRRELLEKKKELDNQIKVQASKRIKDAKDSKMTLAELRSDAIDKTIERLKTESKESRFESPETVDKARILFEPTPKQAEFLAAPEKVVFYGGSAGGGKSYSLIMDAIRFAHRPAMRALIIRRRNSELKELISVSKQLYSKAFPGAKFNETKMIWTFPAGGTLEFGYYENESDKERYIGLPYSYIAWDEIQLQKSPEGFDFLFSRLRTTDPEIECYVRCTGNPGGAPWVKQRFIDPAPPNTTFLRLNPGSEDEGVTYKFIPATLYDNPYLADDGEYEKVLKQLPPNKVRQLLYGDWEVVDDMFFNFNKDKHVIQDMPPLHWPIISSMDYGWVDPASCLWAKVDPSTGALYVYRELEMIQTTVDEWARKMREMEQTEQFTRVQDRVIDHTLFKMTGHTGPSHLETLSRWGFRARPADRQREPGWEQVNQRLLEGIYGQPNLFIHESCVRLIDQLVSAKSKDTNPNDIDDSRMFSLGRRHHWDLLDCLRYLCMARPRTITQDTLLQQSKATSAWSKYKGYFS